MNARMHIAPDGLPRRLFTVADVERMVEVGVIDRDEHIELIEGELIPMSPKGNEHEILKAALNLYWGRRCPPDLMFAPETTFRLSADTYLEPDFVVFPRKVGFRRLDGPSALLAVEIGSSSLGYDLGRKAEIYAKFGIRELWVIDVGSKTLHALKQPNADGYGQITPWRADDVVTPEFAPSFAVCLAELDLSD